MCNGLIGKKLGMIGMFSPEGRQIPVTVVQVGPCTVTQIKTTETDGYNALQLGFGLRKQTRVTKAVLGHFKKAGDQIFSILKEVTVENPLDYTIGQSIGIEIFTVGDRIDVSGVSKGKGFSGVIKRHGFHGGRSTHGSQCHRIPGSIGASAWPSRVVKGKKMPGQFGNQKKTVKNLQIMDVRAEDNVLLIKGAIPGFKSAIVNIRKTNKMPGNIKAI
ncbi:MAG: 50S ribosomal protein L3 [Desulfatirhabdiaceae bacterium]